MPKLEIRFVGNRDGGELYTGYIFTDGSMRRFGRRQDNRGGWAAIVCDSKGLVLYGMYGPNPHEFPTAFNAELLAVVMVLRRGTPPMKIHTDNQSVVDGWRAGRAWTTGSGKTCADLGSTSLSARAWGRHR